MFSTRKLVIFLIVSMVLAIAFVVTIVVYRMLNKSEGVSTNDPMNMTSVSITAALCTPSYSTHCYETTENNMPSTTSSATVTIPLISGTHRVFMVCDGAIGRNAIIVTNVIGRNRCQSPTNVESIESIFDNNIYTKHINTGIDTELINHPLKGLGTGFIVLPSDSGMSVLQAFQFGTGDDVPERDPITISIEGSTAVDQADLEIGSSWSLMYFGWTGINLESVAARNVYGDLVYTNHTTPYRAYRFLIASQRASANGIQYSEVKLFGYFPN